MIELILPYPLSANRYYRNFTPKGRKNSVTVLSREAHVYKRRVQEIARKAGIEKPFTCRVKFEYSLSPKLPKDAERRMKRDPKNWDDTVQCIDLDNAQKVTLDSLEGIIFKNDKMIRQIVGERILPEDEKGKLYVRITPLD